MVEGAHASCSFHLSSTLGCFSVIVCGDLFFSQRNVDNGLLVKIHDTGSYCLIDRWNARVSVTVSNANRLMVRWEVKCELSH